VVSKSVLLLVGPKGCGKSTLGRLLARTYGFAHVEPETVWLEHPEHRSEHAEASSFERAGFLRVADAIGAALRTNDVVVTDTTAASAETPVLVAALRSLGELRVLRVRASEATCLSRIAARDAAKQSITPEELVSAHARSMAARIDAPSTELDAEGTLPSPLFALRGLRAALARVGITAIARPPTLRTERTILRPWRTEDLAPLAAMNADPKVTAHLVAPLSRTESEALLEKIEDGMETYGLGPWALEVPGGHPFAGFCGTWVVGFDTHFTPAVEIAWRLTPSAWGHGYVTESARAALGDAFDRVGLDEVVSFTARDNTRSRAVMERLGMIRDVDGDFEHPRVPSGHRLRAHVLYRARRPK
jgi:RimJ/RimL family protein N-acetyltransferase